MASPRVAPPSWPSAQAPQQGGLPRRQGWPLLLVCTAASAALGRGPASGEVHDMVGEYAEYLLHFHSFYPWVVGFFSILDTLYYRDIVLVKILQRSKTNTEINLL